MNPTAAFDVIVIVIGASIAGALAHFVALRAPTKMDMKRSTTRALIAGIALLAADAGAVTTPPADCKAPLTQADMAACAYEDFLSANGAQASAQRSYIVRLARADQLRWRSAQKAWTAWAAAQCGFESGGSDGGSARNMLHWRCMTRLSRERTAAIERLANCPEGDLACPGRKP